MKKIKGLKRLIIPNRRINFFVITVMLLGILSGSIFLFVLNKSDKEGVILQIKGFFESVFHGSIDIGVAFRNSLIINYLFVFLIWVLGLSVIGIVVNVFLTYIKGFLVGFSIGAIFLSYGVKGFFAGVLYCFLGQVLNVIVVCILTIYSIMFSIYLFRIIGGKSGNHKVMLKKYFVILMLGIVVSFCSSVLEVYCFPNILKMVIGFYVS